jgi:hypothetical protein
VNLLQVTSSGEEVVYAHPSCIDQHNKDVKKKLRTLSARSIAGFVLNHGIDPGDVQSVECLLREEFPRLRRSALLGLGVHLKLSKPFITEIVAAAQEQRDQNCLHAC